MHKPESLAKAAAVMAIVAMLATILAVNIDPPTAQNARNTLGRGTRLAEIPVPSTPKRGVGVAQVRGAAVERREAGGGRAPHQSSASEK